MEQTEQFNGVEENPSYWASIGIAGLIFGIVIFALQTALQYMMAGGSTGFIFSSIAGIVVCLIGAFGGMLAVWHYSNEYDITFKLGKGALIGVLTGLAVAIVYLILMNLWHFIDPNLQKEIMETTIDKMQAANVPDERIEAIKQGMKQGQSLGRQLLWTFPIYAILNLITGMIGVPLFAKEEEEF